MAQMMLQKFGAGVDKFRTSGSSVIGIQDGDTGINGNR